MKVMGLFHLAILALIQGITEFLPVSSSAHLVLFPAVTGQPDQGLVIDIAVHVGTLFAVLVYFHRDVLGLCVEATQYARGKKPENPLLPALVVATLPVVAAGWALYSVEPEGIRSIAAITLTTIVFALLLWLADAKSPQDRKAGDIDMAAALLVGLAQVCALVPGTSRSGVTMTAMRALGFSRTESARFSLLLGIPAIAGAGAIGIWDLYKTGNVALGLDAALACVLSFAAALVSIALMMRWLEKFTFLPFVVYRLCLGAALAIYLGMRMYG